MARCLQGHELTSGGTRGPCPVCRREELIRHVITAGSLAAGQAAAAVRARAIAVPPGPSAVAPAAEFCSVKVMPSALASESWKVKSVTKPRTSTCVVQNALPASFSAPLVNCRRLSSRSVLPFI